MTIAVVVPTIRPESYLEFAKGWQPLFEKHQVSILKVIDGEEPLLAYYPNARQSEVKYSVRGVMSDDADLIHNFSPAVRNLGFAYIARHMPEVDIIITLDDDTLPDGDTIIDHDIALSTVTRANDWMNTFAGNQLYPRGFPYGARKKVPIVLSHGVWHGVADWDAPTQLILGNPSVEFYRGSIPKGVEFAICGMNLAFKRELLPYVYYAPVSEQPGCQRFDDIWMGRHLKRKIDELGLAMVTGYAAVRHERASDPFKNLAQEAIGIRWNEDYWERQGEPFFKMYAEKRARWEALMKGWMA